MFKSTTLLVGLVVILAAALCGVTTRIYIHGWGVEVLPRHQKEAVAGGGPSGTQSSSKRESVEAGSSSDPATNQPKPTPNSDAPVPVQPKVVTGEPPSNAPGVPVPDAKTTDPVERGEARKPAEQTEHPPPTRPDPPWVKPSPKPRLPKINAGGGWVDPESRERGGQVEIKCACGCWTTAPRVGVQWHICANGKVTPYKWSTE